MVNLPSFLKATTPDEASPLTDDREARAHNGWEALQSLVSERDQLRNAYHRLNADYAELHRQYEHDKMFLARETARANHFERFCTELVVQFNTVRMVIDDIQKRAVDVAYKRVAPSPAPTVEGDMPESDKVRMEALAQALAPQGDPNAPTQ